MPQAEDQPTIPLTQIAVSEQCRKHLGEEGIREKAESIKALGLIIPIIVRPLEDHRFELVAGERRLRAARLAGLTEIPAYIRRLSDDERSMLGLPENVSREQ